MTDTVATPAKKPRPLNSGSPAFEEGYAQFIRATTEENVFSVARVETDSFKAIVFAGCRRLRADKKTGLLHAEILTPTGESSEEQWVAAKSFFFDSFWFTHSVAAGVIQEAWSRRLERFLPPANECYPDPLPKKWARSYYSAQYMWDAMVNRASARRLGGHARKSKAIRYLISSVWYFLVDREVLRLCHAYFGRNATFEDYNFTVRRRKDLMARAAETPNLAPLMGVFIKGEQRLKSGRYKLPMNILAQARQKLFTPDINEIRRPHGRRTLFWEEPISPAGWRFFLGNTCAGVSHLVRLAQYEHDYYTHDRHLSAPFGQSAAILNLLAKTGERPPLAFLKWVLPALFNLQGPEQAAEAEAIAKENVLRFIRLAGKESNAAKKKGKLKHFIRGNLQLAWDWFLQRNEVAWPRADVQVAPQDAPPLVRPVPKNATWSSIMRAQHEWHTNREARERAQREADQRAYEEYLAQQDAISWETSLDGCTVQGVQAEPLTTGKSLRIEGKEMNHCVGSYVQACKDGGSRIFALKKEDQRATVEIVKGNRAWKVRQVFGPRNTNVSKEIAAAAKELAKRYQEAEATRESGVMLAAAVAAR